MILYNKTLAIETSCDDTSISIVSFDGRRFENQTILTYSQIKEHQDYGGVVPELAYRSHENKIIWLIEEIWYNQIRECDSISVTKFPWLPWSLVVGNAIANTLGVFLNKPVIEVNHIFGHIFSALLDRDIDQLPLPRVVLTASGGHNELYLVRYVSEQNRDFKLENLQIQWLGHTLDDAAGEAFDKVARMLGWEYPWGPWIYKKKKKGMPQDRFTFKKILLDKNDNLLNFSFSGMKAQVRRLLELYPLETLTAQDIADICYIFEQTVCDILVYKVLEAKQICDCRSILLVGGVSANDMLYDKLRESIGNIDSDLEPILDTNLPDDPNIFITRSITLARPAKKIYSTDNAAMIGVVGILS